MDGHRGKNINDERGRRSHSYERKEQQKHFSDEPERGQIIDKMMHYDNIEASYMSSSHKKSKFHEHCVPQWPWSYTEQYKAKQPKVFGRFSGHGKMRRSRSRTPLWKRHSSPSKSRSPEPKEEDKNKRPSTS